MDPWPFVIAAYTLTFLGTAALITLSWRAMAAAERRAAAHKRER